jgi:cytochrome oxidase Cu insertion factor (SCO1/SenC/PrrC family)
MIGKKTAGGNKGKWIILLLFTPALLLFVTSRGCKMKFKTLEDFGPVNSYSFVDANGKNYTQDDFKDNVIIFTNIQENCLDTCSINLFTFEKVIYQDIRSKKSLKHVKIVSFVNDINGNPVKDLQPTLDMMKDKIHKYDPKKWLLVKNNGETLLQTGDQYYGGNAFQELMLLVDKENHLRMVLRGNMEGMFRRMKECIALLQKEYSTNDTVKNK